MRKVLRFVGAPVHRAARIIPHKERVVIMSVVFLLGGPLIASIEVHVIPHVVLDSLGYLIHGCGCAPLVDRFLARL